MECFDVFLKVLLVGFFEFWCVVCVVSDVVCEVVFENFKEVNDQVFQGYFGEKVKFYVGLKFLGM